MAIDAFMAQIFDLKTAYDAAYETGYRARMTLTEAQRAALVARLNTRYLATPHADEMTGRRLMGVMDGINARD